jgi:hypothetical protein
MQANANTPYMFTVILEDDSETAEVQAVPIPPRAEAVKKPINPQSIQRGMKCAWGRHEVRVEAIDLDEGIAEVYVINRPDLVGPAKLANLFPVTTIVEKNDRVLLWAGEGRPVAAYVMEIDGDTAQFFSPVYKESLWLHTSLIVFTGPRTSRR